MKKICNFLLLAALSLASALSLGSCDEDTLNAMFLDGQWTGNMGMYYADGYGREWDADYTDIRFLPAYEFASYGMGEEVDYFNDPRCPIRYQSFSFTWKSIDGVIYLKYRYNPELNVAIHDYYLDSYTFRGRIGNTLFHLKKLYDYDDWYLYDDSYGYGYGYWDTPYYGKSRTGGDAPADSVGTDVRKFTFGRRFNEK